MLSFFLKLSLNLITEHWEESSLLSKVFFKKFTIILILTILLLTVILNSQEKSVIFWTKSTEWEMDKNHSLLFWLILSLIHSFLTHGTLKKIPEPLFNSDQEHKKKTITWVLLIWKHKTTNKITKIKLLKHQLLRHPLLSKLQKPKLNEKTILNLFFDDLFL